MCKPGGKVVLFSSVKTTWIIHTWLQLKSVKKDLRKDYGCSEGKEPFVSISQLPFDSRTESNPGYATYWLPINLCNLHLLSSIKWVHSYLPFLLCMAVVYFK